MKILIADKLSPKPIAALDKIGADITSNPDLKAEELSEAIGNANVLIVRSTKVYAETIEAGKSLELIIRAGAGVNNIDLKKPVVVVSMLPIALERILMPLRNWLLVILLHATAGLSMRAWICEMDIGKRKLIKKLPV